MNIDCLLDVFERPRTQLLVLIAVALIFPGCGSQSPNVRFKASSVVRFKASEVVDKISCRTLAFSPDGSVLFAGGSSHWTRGYQLQLWDAALKKELATLPSLGTPVPVFSQDRSVLYMGGLFGDVSRRDAASVSILNESEGHSDTIRVLAISPNGNWLATANDDGKASLRDPTTLSELHDVSAESGKVLSLSFTADSTRLLAGSCKGIVSIWSLTDSPRVADQIPVGLPVDSMALSADDSILATRGSEKCGPNVTTFWSVASKQLLKTLPDVNRVLFSPDHSNVAVTSHHKATVTLYDARTLTEKFQINGNRATHYTLGFEPVIAFSPDGKTLAIGVDKVRLVHVADGREIETLAGMRGSIKALQFSTSGLKLAGADTYGDLTLWNTSTGNELSYRSKHGLSSPQVQTLEFIGDDERILVGSIADDTANYGVVQVIDSGTGQIRRTLKGHTRPVCSLSISPNGNQLVTSSWDRTVRLWEVDSGRQLGVLTDQPGIVFGVDFSPDGSLIATAGSEVSIWNSSRREILLALSGSTGLHYCVRFSPDGSSLAAAGSDGIVHVWQMPQGTSRWSSRKLGWPVRSVAFTPNGNRLVVGGGDFEHGMALVCDAENGRELFSLEGHTGPVTAVAVSEDGDQIYTAGTDQIFRVWNATTGQQVLEERGFGSPLAALAVQPGGRIAVASGLNGYRWLRQ